MKAYRADIDGLRAIAVLCVLFFHLDISLFSGGFVGVDVFFTISGFLISGIIIRELVAGPFSFKNFYIRRALRILPAYLFLLLCCIITGYILLTPIAYKELIESAIASSVFLSNIYFLVTQGGYFSSAAHELPLLHTWSLSVEEQFYLIMPIVFVLWFKIKSNKFKIIALFIIFFISLIISYFLTSFNQKVAYYIVLTRIFEFLLGSILAFLAILSPDKIVLKTKLSNILFLISIAMLLFSAIFIDSTVPFPSVTAVVPCLATAILILVGYNPKCISHKVLGNRLLVAVGLISYSLYLWHWPLVAYAKYIGIEFTITVQLTIGLLTFISAFLSWKYIEQSFRHLKGSKKTNIAISLYLVPSVLLFLFYFYGKGNQYFPERFDESIVFSEQSYRSKPEDGRGDCHTGNDVITLNPKCFSGDIKQSEVEVVLWGDSHANHFIGVIDELARSEKLKVQDITMGNCPPIIGLNVNLPGARQYCINKNINTLSYITQLKPEFVVLAGAWAGYSHQDLNVNDDENSLALIEKGLSDTINILQSQNIKVIVFEMLPRMVADKSNCSLKQQQFPSVNSLGSCLFDNTYKTLELRQFYFNIREHVKNKVEFIDVSEFFCEDNVCQTWLDTTPLYRDSNHLNLVSSHLLGKKLLNLKSTNIFFTH